MAIFRTIILLTNTADQTFFILYISRSSTFLCSNLSTCIVFQSFRTILLLNTSEVSFFNKGLCIFAILSTTALNFPKSNVQRNFFQNILKEIGNVQHIFIFIFFVLVIWQFNAILHYCIFYGDYFNDFSACLFVLHIFYFFTNFSNYNSSSGSTLLHIIQILTKMLIASRVIIMTL